METSVDTTRIEALLETWIVRQAESAAGAWFSDSMARLRDAPSDRTVNMLVSLVTRRLGKSDLALTAADLEQAGSARPGWDARLWSIDQAARVAMLLAAHDGDDARFAARLEQLCRTADVGELVAFYRGLPLYPDPPRHRARAAEGIRTNMRAVFEAVAHHNPYPTEQLDAGAWNQMVLKALFIGSTLHPVVGLDGRANAELAHMLCDYAEERWSANRPVSAELWRPVARHADERTEAALERALAGDDATCRAGAALAMHDSAEPRWQPLLARAGDLKSELDAGRLAWASLA